MMFYGQLFRWLSAPVLNETVFCLSWKVNSSHAVRDLGRVRQYPLWLLFTTFVDSVEYPRYNPQKTRKQWREIDDFIGCEGDFPI